MWVAHIDKSHDHYYKKESLAIEEQTYVLGVVVLWDFCKQDVWVEVIFRLSIEGWEQKKSSEHANNYADCYGSHWQVKVDPTFAEKMKTFLWYMPYE